MEKLPVNPLFKNLVKVIQITHDQCDSLTTLSGQCGVEITRYHYRIKNTDYGLVSCVIEYGESYWLEHTYLADIEQSEEHLGELLKDIKTDVDVYEETLHIIQGNSKTIATYINDNLKEKPKHE